MRPRDGRQVMVLTVHRHSDPCHLSLCQTQRWQPTSFIILQSRCKVSYLLSLSLLWWWTLVFSIFFLRNVLYCSCCLSSPSHYLSLVLKSPPGLGMSLLFPFDLYDRELLNTLLFCCRGWDVNYFLPVFFIYGQAEETVTSPSRQHYSQSSPSSFMESHG